MTSSVTMGYTNDTTMLSPDLAEFVDVYDSQVYLHKQYLMV